MIHQPQPVRRCELCERQYVGQTDAAGLCHDCSGNLGGGKFSARIVQQANAGRRVEDKQPKRNYR